jgi:hypothetical protein
MVVQVLGAGIAKPGPLSKAIMLALDPIRRKIMTPNGPW